MSDETDVNSCRFIMKQGLNIFQQCLEVQSLILSQQLVYFFVPGQLDTNIVYMCAFY